MGIALLAITLTLLFYGSLVAFGIRWFSKRSSKPQMTASVLAVIVCGLCSAVGMYEHIARSGNLTLVIAPLLVAVIIGGQLALRRN